MSLMSRPGPWNILANPQARLAALLLALCLAGCAGPGGPQRTGAGPDAAGDGTAANPAVQGLLEQAARQQAAGYLEAAAASIERALRIAPDSVPAYQALARLRLEQGDTWQAEALALKANSLAVGHPEVQAENWSIIAAARRQRGDMPGADAAARAAAVLRQNGG